MSELRESSDDRVQELEMRLREIGTRKLAIVGVGNPLRGDDFAGSFVVKKLMRRLPLSTGRTLLLDAETSPENMTGRIRSFGPEAVMFVDSAVMGSRPGTIKLVNLKDTKYPYFSSHSLPLKVLTNLLSEDAQAFVLGIEPEATEFGEKISPHVRVACEDAVDMVCRALQDVG